jgi:hypothetical protein
LKHCHLMPEGTSSCRSPAPSMFPGKAASSHQHLINPSFHAVPEPTDLDLHASLRALTFTCPRFLFFAIYFRANRTLKVQTHNAVPNSSPPRGPRHNSTPPHPLSPRRRRQRHHLRSPIARSRAPSSTFFPSRVGRRALLLRSAPRRHWRIWIVWAVPSLAPLAARAR